MARSLKFIISFLFLPAALVCLAQTAPQNRIAQAVDNAQFATIRGSGHPLAKPAFDRGRVNGGMQLRGVSMVFKPSSAQQQEIQKLSAELKDRNSPNYHKWLSPEKYADRFGMTQSDIAKISTWLVAQGFTIDGVARGRTQISFSGTAAQIESVFHSEIHQYEVNGEKHFANAGAVSVPVALSSVVLGVSGLNDFRPKAHSQPRPSPKFTSSSSGNHFLAPNDFAAIYDVKALYDQGIDGTGQSIVVVGNSTVTLSNIATFRSLSGLPVNNPTTTLVPSTGTGGIPSTGDQIEAYLDLEWSGAIARNAQIKYVYVGNTAPLGVFSALFYAIDQNLAPVISNSYGLCEAGIPLSDATSIRGWITEADLQGQSVTSASGDSGAADCDDGVAVATGGLAVDFPAAIPEVTAVGGGEFTGDAASTSTTTYWNGTDDSGGGSAIGYIPEEIWNDTAASVAQNHGLAGGGGGFSTLFAKPSWQTVPGVPADGHRDVPDLSLAASNFHDPYLLCDGTAETGLQSCTNGFRNSNGGLDAVGGTSAGAPTFAGILALLDQAIDPTGLGSVNQDLYGLAGSNGFHDITAGDNIQPCTPGTPSSAPVAQRCPSSGTMGFSAGPGYDQASGIGSIDAYNLVRGWPGFSVTPSYTVGGTPVTIASAGGVGTSTVTVAAVNGFNGTVTLSCTPPAATAKITCSIAPSVTVNGSSDTATLTVNTTAAHARSGGASASNQSPGLGWLGAGESVALAGILVIGVPSRRKWTTLFAMVLGAFMLTGMACGGGGSSSPSPTVSGTPAGHYTVVVTAVSGSSQRTVNVAVTVQ